MPVQNAKHKKNALRGPTRFDVSPCPCPMPALRIFLIQHFARLSSQIESDSCKCRAGQDGEVTHERDAGPSQPWPEPLSASPGVALLRLSPLYAPRPCWHQNHALLHALARFVSSTSRTASHALSVRLVRTTNTILALKLENSTRNARPCQHYPKATPLPQPDSDLNLPRRENPEEKPETPRERYKQSTDDI